MSANVQEPNEIKIVGHGDKLFPYAEIKNAVVKIRNEYYRKDSPDVVKIVMPNGKIRFFREKSPLIIKTQTGYILKSAAIKTEDDVYLDPNDPDVVKIGEKYHRKAFCLNIGGRWYLKTDPLVGRDSFSGKFHLKSDLIELSKKYYQNAFTIKDNTVLTIDNQLVRKGDAHEFYDPIAETLIFRSLSDPALRDYQREQVLYDFQDKTNPQVNRLVFKQVLITPAVKDELIPFQLAEGCVYTISKQKLAYFTDALERYIMPRILAETEKVRDRTNKNFSDLDDRENVAKTFKIINEPWPGKHSIYKPESFKVPVFSRAFSETGGLKYSFGVEFETSQGLLTNTALEQVGLFAVGDRSIGAAEYVTPPMQGNAGIERLRLMCEALNRKTLVDDRCGLHVHVGTLFQPASKGDTPTSKEAPSFSKDFLINSIKLGCYLEEELFSSLPPNRIPTLYHCHSIRRFEPIDSKNFDVYLGAFIFGPKEKWLTEKGTITTPFEMAPYALGQRYNQNSELGVWAEGRYKWLNLIHSYTRSKHRTIEFRIFSGTTVFDKVYAYLLTSLAFTYVADNKPKLIKPGVTLAQVFEAAFPKHEPIVTFLNNFYESRKKKFNRKNLYPNLTFLK